MLKVKSFKTGQEQELSQKDLKTIDPNGTKFAIVSNDTTPPEAKASTAKKPSEDQK